MQLSGKVAIITGGASGLGAATARHFAQSGAKVVIADRDGEPAERLADELGGLAAICDVTDEMAVERTLDLAEGLGEARILVNCAGVAPAARIVGREGPMPLDNFSRTIAINLTGTFNVLRLFAARASGLPALDDGERAVVINTASVAAYEGQVGQAAYAAAKGGIVALTLPAARELAGAGVRVNAIAPGIFATPMMAGMPDSVQDALAASVPFPARLGHGEEYAALAAHIVGNAYINGSVIRLDGALRMAPR